MTSLYFLSASVGRVGKETIDKVAEGLNATAAMPVHSVAALGTLENMASESHSSTHDLGMLSCQHGDL
jgi:hypothetical protein